MYGIPKSDFFFKYYNIVSNIKSDWKKVLKEENLDHTRQKENKVKWINIYITYYLNLNVCKLLNQKENG